MAITVKVPEDIATKLREYAHSTGSTIGDVVSRAVTSLLARERRRGLSATSAAKSASSIALTVCSAPSSNRSMTSWFPIAPAAPVGLPE